MLAFPDDLVLQRLRALPQIKLFGASPELAEAAKTTPRNAPALYLATQTTGRASEYSGSTVQGTRTTVLQLVLWTQNHGGPEKLLAERKALAEAIDARLIGWTPDDAIEELFQESMRDQFVHGAWLVTQLFYRANWTYSGQRQ